MDTPPDEQRTRIDGEPHHVASGHGAASLVFGLLAAAAGIPAVLRGLGVITVGRVHAPMWVIVGVGALFVAAGLLLGAAGVAGLRARAWRRDARVRWPAEPWRHDHDWPADGVGDGAARRALRGLLGVWLLGAFLVPFLWWAFGSGDGPLPVRLVVGAFAALFALAAGAVAMRLLRLWRFGQGRLALPIPLRPGQRVDAGLRVRTDLLGCERMHATLRFVEEVYETRGHGQNRTKALVRYALWQRRWVVEQPTTGPFGLGPVPVSFALPPRDDLVTCFAGTPVRYWELALVLEGPGLDYVGSFALPVYAAPAPAHSPAPPLLQPIAL